MDIRILSAGKEIGPYSESQVRQYLSEGLISSSDPAICEGLSEWEPVGQLLTRLPVAESQVENTNGSEEDNESARSVTVRATSNLRSKRGPIVLQSIFSADGDTSKRPRAGKAALTIEPPRPTTQLPPVAKFVPKEERKGPRPAISTGALVPANFFARPASDAASHVPTTPPEAGEDIFTTQDPQPAPEPDVAPEQAGVKSHGLPNAIWYASLLLGLIGLGLLMAIGYLIWHFGTPAPRGAQSSATPAPAVVTAPVTPPPPVTPHTAAEFSARGYSRQLQGNLDDALSDFDQAVSLDPKNAEALYRRAVARQTKGNWNDALSDFNNLLTLDPTNADAFSNRGYVKQRLGDTDGALADYTEALSRKPTIPEAFYNVGLIKVSRGDIDGGIAAYNSAIDLNPKLTRAYYNRGNAKGAENNLDGAIADYTQAIELGSSNAMAYLNRANARRARNDSNGAFADYSDAIARDSNLAPAYYSRGEIEVQRGDFDAAVADGTKAIELDPKQVRAFFNRGLAELGQRNLDHAGADFEKFCEEVPHATDSDSARLYLWVIAAQQNARDKADDDLNYAVLNDWNSSPEDLTSKIADFLVGHIREPELIADASTPDPTLEPARFCKVWYFAGIKRLITGDTATAQAYFQKSLATGQKDFCEYLFARSQLVSLGQSRQASSQTSGPVPPQ